MKFKKIFKKGSVTYYYSSVFFDKKTKNDVATLYAFVRTIDDFVDSIPQQKKEYEEFKSRFYIGLSKGNVENQIINDFIELARRKKFHIDWIDAFFYSMEMDIEGRAYVTDADVEEYMVGSAEVIGLMMAQILDLPTTSHDAARHLGKSMQYINFIRDVAEDEELGRCYFPKNDLKICGLHDIKKETAIMHPERFKKVMRMQIKKYKEWQEIAEQGFAYIPKRYLIPIKTASDMYLWTAQKIEDNPLVVFRKKIKPKPKYVAFGAIKNSISI